jgi:hypothetical protein
MSAGLKHFLSQGIFKEARKRTSSYVLQQREEGIT